MAGKILELTPEQLRSVCDESLFDFKSTSEITPTDEVVGQERAVEAIEFGMSIDGSGYNIFALGPVGVGRTSIIKRFVQAKAKKMPKANDWCYVHNFKEPDKPQYLRLPTGKGKEFRRDMENLILVLREDIQQVLHREDYQSELNAIMEKMQKEKNEHFSGLEQQVQKQGFALQRGPTGLFIVPILDEKPLSPENFQKLPEEKRQELEGRAQSLQQDLQRTIHTVRNLDEETRRKLKTLKRDTILFAVEHHINTLKEKYQESSIESYIDTVKENVVSNPDEIIAKEKNNTQQLPNGIKISDPDSSFQDRYRVNLIIDNSETEGAPVVVETNPIFQNLIGRVERKAQFGTLTTNFNLIKPGALHKANGGYLIVEAEHLLRSPFSYNSLKHALKDEEIKIVDMSEVYNQISTVALEPEPIPLDVKIILIGNPITYFQLYNLDEEFHELFKVKADFGIFMDKSDENINMYALFLALRCKEDNICHFGTSGIARIVEYGSELVGDQTKLSTCFADIRDLARESSYWAKKNGCEIIKRDHVQKAIDAKLYRINRAEDLTQEMIEKDEIFINAEGEIVGQVNGLSIINLGDYSFGKPTRITARTYAGQRSVINIEREAKMSGPIHNKGILTLTGYLNGKYLKNRPISLTASIGFEQLYEGIEGDSASSAELYSLLSSLSGFPVKQGLAVTGSVNQRGEIQPIGGITKKIEGFFDVCKRKGFTGKQGVIIPESNIKNLMLRQEIVDLVKEGKFHVYPVQSIDQGIEILTGRKAGDLQSDGTYSDGTVNQKVDKRLQEFSESLKNFQQKKD